ncbi:hypothetical protein ACFOLE_04775 [Staphylococcus piscifermentans]|nr:hypothetical protein [Staphylococcus piscifermentans]
MNQLVLHIQKVNQLQKVPAHLTVKSLQQTFHYRKVQVRLKV